MIGQHLAFHPYMTPVRSFLDRAIPFSSFHHVRNAEHRAVRQKGERKNQGRFGKKLQNPRNGGNSYFDSGGPALGPPSYCLGDTPVASRDLLRQGKQKSSVRIGCFAQTLCELVHVDGVLARASPDSIV